MPDTVLIENIETMRLREGIDDVELRAGVRRLAVGDVVRLTLVAGGKTAETLPVRITAISGTNFRGRLTAGPTCSALAALSEGSTLDFTAAHIHSLLKVRLSR